MKYFFGRLRRVIGTLLVAIVALIALGVTYQSISYWRDTRRFPQRGRSFRVESFTLNLNCTGQGHPTVIFDSGMGGTSMDWYRIQPEIARFTSVCSYDRAGYGWSDSSPTPRTSLQIAKELKELLVSAGEPGPFLLVGHSYGGYNVRMFTKLYPTDVLGMVLVDAEHPDETSQQKRLQDSLPLSLKARIERNEKHRQLWSRIYEPLELYCGVDRIKLALGGTYSQTFPKELQAETLFLEQQPKYIKATEAENKLDEESAAEIRAAGDLGNRPLIVLTADKPYAGDSDDNLLTPEQRSSRDNLWIHQLQLQYAHLSNQGKQVIVANSSHEMPADRPDAIVAAVKEVWRSTKSASSVSSPASVR